MILSSGQPASTMARVMAPVPAPSSRRVPGREMSTRRAMAAPTVAPLGHTAAIRSGLRNHRPKNRAMSASIGSLPLRQILAAVCYRIFSPTSGGRLSSKLSSTARTRSPGSSRLLGCAVMMVAEFAIGFCAAATLVHLATIAMAGIRCRRRSARPISRKAMPAVSVLRPVCGAENFLDETLASTFRLDCPEYEIIFCAARADDAAVPIVNRLIAANPQIPARLLVGDDGIGANPKLSNLVKGWDAARYDWVLIADSNALLRPDLVHDLFAAWRPDTGVVCSMPIGSRPKTFAAELECAFLEHAAGAVPIFQRVSAGDLHRAKRCCSAGTSSMRRAGFVRSPPRPPRTPRRPSWSAAPGCMCISSTGRSSSRWAHGG